MSIEVIRRIWKSELNLSDFSDDDDFFALGGHSLLMAQIQAGLKVQTGLEVPMDDLFRYPTVNALCSFLASSDAPSLSESGVSARD